jgi:hypothetical protein
MWALSGEELAEALEHANRQVREAQAAQAAAGR